MAASSQRGGRILKSLKRGVDQLADPPVEVLHGAVLRGLVRVGENCTNVELIEALYEDRVVGIERVGVLELGTGVRDDQRDLTVEALVEVVDVQNGLEREVLRLASEADDVGEARGLINGHERVETPPVQRLVLGVQEVDDDRVARQRGSRPRALAVTIDGG